MSKEIHPTQQAYADGVKYGKELCALPWRKPEERPEVDRSIVIYMKFSFRWGYLNGLGDFRMFGGTEFEWSQVDAWLYSEDLPLPEWVK